MNQPKPQHPHPMGLETWREDYLRTSELTVDERYQRKLREHDVNAIARSWSDSRCLYLEVNQRPDGTYAIMNGQHRWAAAKIAGVEWLPCRVYSFPSTELEALWFEAQARNQKAPDALDRFKARLHAGDVIAKEIEAVLAEYGWVISFSTGRSQPGNAWAVTALETQYRRDPQRFRQVLWTLTAAWDRAPNTLSDLCLWGTWFFYEKYGKEADWKRVIDVLKRMEPSAVRARALNRAQLAGGGSAEKHLCEMIAELYDKGKKSSRLRPLPAEE